MLKEFKAFAMRGNVVDLAVGVIIGSAFGKIVASFVGDIIMPIINPIVPGGDWRAIEVGSGIKLGNFMGNVLDFLIVAFVIFLMIRAINSTKKKEEAAPAAPVAPPADVALLTEIRDLLKK
ncbi:MAG: large conductance mechanosensitive channel protein MscL [Cyclobacteriaceae bacterium]|nr:large conductance mechanosensitive channel protein MscL [Cyclobacteriaceae bacterium]